MFSKGSFFKVVKSWDWVVKSKTHNKDGDLTKIESIWDNLNVARGMEFVYDGVETLWKKEKMLVNSIFSSSVNVFKRVIDSGDCVIKKLNLLTI